MGNNNQQQSTENNNQNQNSNDDNSNNNNNSNDNNNQNSNENNNNSNNMDNNTSIWDNNDSSSDNNDQNNNQQNNQNNQNTETRSAGEIFNDHIQGLQLTDGVDVNKIQEDLANNDTESLQSAFESIASNTYKAGLQQANKLMDTKIEAAIEKAVAESGSAVNESMAVREMQSKLPFVSGQDIAPVAEAALKQFISKGLSVEDSIQKVAEFFNATAQAVSGNNNSQNSPGNNNFNPNSFVSNNSNNQNNSNQDDSWMDVLMAK